MCLVFIHWFGFAGLQPPIFWLKRSGCTKCWQWTEKHKHLILIWHLNRFSLESHAQMVLLCWRGCSTIHREHPFEKGLRNWKTTAIAIIVMYCYCYCDCARRTILASTEQRCRRIKMTRKRSKKIIIFHWKWTTLPCIVEALDGWMAGWLGVCVQSRTAYVLLLTSSVVYA